MEFIFSEEKAGMSFPCCGGNGVIWKEVSAYMQKVIEKLQYQ